MVRTLVQRCLGALFCFALVALCASASVVRAEDEGPSHSQVALAREQFVAGVEAARSNDWPKALRAFERSQALYPHAATLFNIAGARRRLGNFVAAVEAYRRFLLTPAGEVNPGQRSEAESAIADMEPRLARLTLHVENGARGDVVTLDGGVVAQAMFGQEIPVDPGQHELTLTRDGTVVARASLLLAESQHGDTKLRAPVSEGKAAVVEPHESQAAAALGSAPREQVDSPPHRRRWVWIAVGVAAVAVGGTVAAVMLTRDKDKDYVGNFDPGEVEIR